MTVSPRRIPTPRSRPLVSLGVPVYNGEAYLEEALDSLRSQTVEDLEIVIVDNQSTDATIEIAEAAEAADPRVRVLRNPENLGAAGNNGGCGNFSSRYSRIANDCVRTFGPSSNTGTA